MTEWRDRPISQMFSWADWLQVRHPGLALTKLVLPTVGAAAAFVALTLEPGWNIAREFGLVHQVNGLLQILAAFFIAALALIASFPGEALDKPMGGVPPKIVESDGDDYEPTRREFFGIMFAYLSAVCVILYVLGAFAMSAANPTPNAAGLWFATAMNGWLSIAGKAIYAGAVVHVLSTTLLSLHFLGGYLSSSRTARGPVNGDTPAATGVVQPMKRKA